MALWTLGVSPRQASAASTAGYCGVPGKDGSPASISGVVNTYYAAAATGTASGNTITLGKINNPSGSPAIAKNDLLIVMQMQDGGSISVNNDTTYGTGTTTAGTYEYAVAASVAGTVVTLVQNLLHTYTENPALGRSYQVVRVPQYASTALTSGLAAAPWNGASGGVLAIDVAGTVNLNGAALTVAGDGFRGGGGVQLAGATGAETDYVTADSLAVNGEKGEGDGGTPLTTYATVAGLVTNAQDTLPVPASVGKAASFGRGAPLNAGGGGTDDDPPANDENTGGGGGGNGGAGGQGGYDWNTNAPNGAYETARGDGTTGSGGVGGHAFTAAANNLVLGGGGGAGTRNNSAGADSSGGPGGGLVLVRTASVSGTGSITADGQAGVVPQNDGGGGGGAGGSVMVLAANAFAGLTVSAVGAAGTNANPGAVEHGPGGGGGGGLYIGSSTATTTLTGGANGLTGPTTSEAYGAAPGSAGTKSTATVTGPDGAEPGEACTYAVFTGPYLSPQATGNYTGGAADNMHDFTAYGVVCTNGGAINNGTFSCSLPTGAAAVAVVNTLQNAGTANDTFTLTGTPPAGYAVTFYNASACTGGSATWPTCTRGAQITAPVTVAPGATFTYLSVFTAATGVTPLAASTTKITATGSMTGDTNDTYDVLYPGGVLLLTKTATVQSSNCSGGGTTMACGGGVLKYQVAYQNIAPAGLATGGTGLGTEPAFALLALTPQGIVLTEDGAVGSTWSATTFGINASPVPSDTTTGTTFTYANDAGFSATALASGTYPAITQGFTIVHAAVGGTGAKLQPAAGGTISFYVTVK